MAVDEFQAFVPDSILLPAVSCESSFTNPRVSEFRKKHEGDEEEKRMLPRERLVPHISMNHEAALSGNEANPDLIGPSNLSRGQQTPNK